MEVGGHGIFFEGLRKTTKYLGADIRKRDLQNMKQDCQLLDRYVCSQ
jgi:hypothetical protein